MAIMRKNAAKLGSLKKLEKLKNSLFFSRQIGCHWNNVFGHEQLTF